MDIPRVAPAGVPLSALHGGASALGHPWTPSLSSDATAVSVKCTVSILCDAVEEDRIRVGLTAFASLQERSLHS